MLLFKKDIKYSLDGKTIEEHIFRSREEYSLDLVLTKLGKNNLDFFIKEGLIFEKQEEVETPKELEIQEPVFEIMYKTTQQIQDKDGNEIEVGTQFTAEELKKKGFTKKKLEALIQEEKVMEVKIVK